jgi:hypothetical protein
MCGRECGSAGAKDRAQAKKGTAADACRCRFANHRACQTQKTASAGAAIDADGIFLVWWFCEAYRPKFCVRPAMRQTSRMSSIGTRSIGSAPSSRISEARTICS